MRLFSKSFANTDLYPAIRQLAPETIGGYAGSGYTIAPFTKTGFYIMSVKIYHNPSCSKCRQTMELLEEASITPDIVEYLNSPPNRDELIEILAMLDMSPRELMRTHESEYKDNQLDDDSLSTDALIDAMIRFPILIERPIVVSNGKAVIGRPPVNVKTII